MQKLTNVTIPDRVADIGVNAFTDCSSLTNVTIPSSITSIGGWAFCGCTRLAGIRFKGNAPSLGSSVFDGDDSATVYYLSGTTGLGHGVRSSPTAPWNPPANGQ